MSLRKISRRLGISRNTVAAIVKQQGLMPQNQRRDKLQIDPELLVKLYGQCERRIQRVHEKLVEEEGIMIKYSTLTRLMRELQISNPPKVRCDHKDDVPGCEMQHDTSPYKVMIGGRRMRVIASILYLRYSKRRYLRFYRSFNRFGMKCFLHEALRFWGYSARECIIDNTNLARLRGSGSDALIVPEMVAFSRQYGFTFCCHAIGHANRKAGEERSFWTVETNFFPGRSFRSLEDMNQQAFDWATVRMEQRLQTKARIIPTQAFAQEKAYLVKVPEHIPAPYLTHRRIIDQYGYVAFDGNFYWVPGKQRGEVMVLQYSDSMQVYHGRERLCQYALPGSEVKNQRFSPPGEPRPRHQPNNRKQSTRQEQMRLRSISPAVGEYLDLVLKPKGMQRHSFVRKLHGLSRRMTEELFIRVIGRACKYGVTSIATIERIARIYMTQGQEDFDLVQIDESFRDREAYQEGALSDAPDLSSFDRQPGDDDE